MFKNTTRGGQIFFHNWRMFKQVILKIFALYFCLLLLSFASIAYYTGNKYEVSAWVGLKKAQIAAKFTDKPLKNVKVIGLENGREISDKFTSRQLFEEPYFSRKAAKVDNKLFWAFIIPFSIWTPLFLIAGYMIRRRTKAKFSGEELVRGSSVSTPKAVNKMLKSENRLSPLMIGKQHLVYDSEVKHIVLHGTTGTGKTVIVKDLLRQIRPRYHRAVILDDGGAYAQSFYDESRGDIILNPFDARCPNWNAWDECVETIDYDNFAAALIPDEADKDKFWVQSARNLLSSLMQEMKKRGQTSYEALLQYCLNYPLEKLQEVLKDTPAEQLVDGDIAKTAITIRAVITNHVKALRFLPQEPSRPKFSFREWVMNDHKGACVFVVIRDKDIQAIRSLISLWIGLLTTHVKSLERSRQRRIWLILDELMKLNRLTSLPDTLATGRNYGLSCILGIQNKAQLRSTYGRDEAQEIFDLLSTQVFLRSTSADIADEISKELGECEVIERLESSSYGAESVRDGISINPTRRTKRIVSYTEIQDMNDLEVYIKLPAHVPRVKMKLTLSKETKELSANKVARSGFIERDMPINKALENKLNYEVARSHGGANFNTATGEVVNVVSADNGTSLPENKVGQTGQATQTESKVEDSQEINHQGNAHLNQPPTQSINQTKTAEPIEDKANLKTLDAMRSAGAIKDNQTRHDDVKAINQKSHSDVGKANPYTVSEKEI
ncbi:type IV conjugative transfer system coupling protein TraD [Cysteiniphilum marinum]|uniref:type IV conjugative transfer system coupling protein TraD n=1 Tax=Cysteiniphilum marinum TaxID=2774191 RepID=UPI001939D2F1|nr:type IV conjugative transfer system coupling protein TraD [Cysteiniphilum marinum]